MAKILIAEDEPLISRMYQQALAFEGYEVEIAPNGKEAWEKLKKNGYTLVLLDIMMPEVNGLEVLDYLKSDPKHKNTPVVMLTNLSGTQEAQKALELGAVKYIIKSQYKPKQVVDMVKEIVAASSREEIPQAVSSGKG